MRIQIQPHSAVCDSMTAKKGQVAIYNRQVVFSLFKAIQKWLKGRS